LSYREYLLKQLDNSFVDHHDSQKNKYGTSDHINQRRILSQPRGKAPHDENHYDKQCRIQNQKQNPYGKSPRDRHAEADKLSKNRTEKQQPVEDEQVGVVTQTK